ncbi:MAG TPA: hypothetical protein VK045_01475 [Ornithinicoccus sp.]|nr:hypothetical protein [Ornithinicoccus sp.]
MRLRRTPRTASFAAGFGGLAELVQQGALAVQDSLGMGVRARQADLDRLRTLDAEAQRARSAIVELARDSFVTPFDRGDIHQLAVRLAECLTHMERAVDAGIRHGVEEFPEGSASLLDAVVRLSELTTRALASLHTADGVADYPQEIRLLVARAEPTHRGMLAEILAGTADPLRAVRTAAVVEELVLVLRAFEQVATVVEGIVVKEA